jgi:hypothetical protein
MNHRQWVAFVLLTLGLLSGCASSDPGRDIDDPSNSLVFGHIDMSDAPTQVKFASILQVAPPTDKPYWGTLVNNGLFHSSYLPPGTYQLASFGGSSFFGGGYEYDFGRQGRNQTAVRIDKPGIYYLGSYKYKKIKTGLFDQDKFAIERVNTPTEAELLKRILEKDSEVKGSKWAAKIRARLGQLK